MLLDQSLKPVICDFGLSRFINGKDEAIYSSSDYGPLKWMAPETMNKRKFSEKSDVWSFAVTCVECISRDKEPYMGMSKIEVSLNVMQFKLKPKIPTRTPEKMKKILEMCLEYEPSFRPTFKEICKMLE